MSTSTSLTNTKQYIFMSLVLMVWLFVYFTPLSSMVSVWQNSNTYTHGFFILPICLWLLWQHKQALLKSNTQVQPVWILALAFIQITYLIASTLGINLLSQICAYLSLVCIFLTFFGFQLVVRFIFPVIFLGFSIPFGEEFVPQLQIITAEFSVFMLRLFSIPVYQEGLYLYIPGGTFKVAEACAGIRFLIASIAIGVLCSYLFYQSYWKRFIFICIACTLPILANGIRAFGIIAIGHYSDMKHATGADHLVYGWFFFMFVMILLLWIGQIGQEKEQPKEPYQYKLAKAMTPLILTITLVTLLLMPVYSKLAFNHNKLDIEQAQIDLNQKISNLNEATIYSEEKLPWQPIFNDAPAIWQGTIKDHQVFIAYYPFDDVKHELINGTHRPYNIESYVITNTNKHSLNNVQSVQQIDLANTAGDKRSIIYWYQTSNMQTPDGLKIKLNQLPKKLLNKNQQGYFMAVQIDPTSDANAHLDWVNLFKQWQGEHGSE